MSKADWALDDYGWLTRAIPLPANPMTVPPEKFLFLSEDMKLHHSSMVLDAKKICWVPDPKDGYVVGDIVSTKGDDVIIKAKGAELTVKKDDLQQVNPAKFEKCEDMANLTYLNDAGVLHNLRQRYYVFLIYTYSGLFCVTINPYRRFAIYTQAVCEMFKGKRRQEMPPHVFSVSDNAYTDMLLNREDQSILITGESGAGKTENTKKVISYFAVVGQNVEDKGSDKSSLEDQIVQANPVLEAFGNAKTTRNDNSSRFGKFIRIHFGAAGKLAGADIESYLLEKSRVTYQGPKERNYHIFYQIMAEPKYRELFFLTNECTNYSTISHGKTVIEGVDDKEEMRLTDEAFGILGFTTEESVNSLRICAAIMHFMQMKFKQRPREEQAETDTTEDGEKASKLFSINEAEMFKNVLKPRIKVGTEYVSKGQTLDQVHNSVSGLSRAMFDRLFKWLVTRINVTLDAKKKRQFFIGVLDIAGFEIFEFNTFEQLCINFTNERLQQYFNHHMFVLEQEEYKKEGIDWVFIDFGMDLQACIDLIEKPLGIIAILEEECIVPKATDKTFLEKVVDKHLGKSKSFYKPKPSKDPTKDAHIGIAHYAGNVGYNVDHWLDKNKDPLNESVLKIFAKSQGNPLVAELWKDRLEEEASGGAGKKKKGAAFQTISSLYKEQLNKLMTTLNNTSPHFVRCIIPNEHKAAGEIDASLVMNQLTCNGVLEGIRICRKGFPNRILYAEFKFRYIILNPQAASGDSFVDNKEISAKIVNAVGLDPNTFRLGATKIFFKAGILGLMEEYRDEKIGKVMTLFQAWVRFHLMQKAFIKLKEQRTAMIIIQRNIKKWISMRTWLWWKLYTKVKPMLNAGKVEDELKKLQEEVDATKAELEKEAKMRKEFEEQMVTLTQEKNDLMVNLESEKNGLQDYEDRLSQLVKQKAETESELRDLNDRLSEEEETNSNLQAAKRKAESEISDYKKDINDLEINLQKSEQEKQAKENQIRSLQDEISRQEDLAGRSNKEKKSLDENLKKTQEDLSSAEDKLNHMNKVKAKLEQTLDELEDNLEHEKKVKSDLEKSKKKLEQDLKMTQEQVQDLENAKRELEELSKRKDKDLANVNSKLEDEQSLVASLQRKIKELQARIEELEEELEAERQARSKVEKQRAELSREIDDISERLEEQGGATSAQVELNRKRETEINKMRKDLEEAMVQHEAAANALRKKHNDAVSEMGEQIDQLQKIKTKLEKEKSTLKNELEDLKSGGDMVQKAKASSEKAIKSIESQLQESMSQLDDSNRNVQDLASIKNRLQNENVQLQKQLEDAESQINSLSKAKSMLTSQLNEARSSLEEESREKASLSSALRNAQHDLDQIREQYEEEQEARGDLQRQLSKLNNEYASLKSKFDGEAVGRSEELEEIRKRLQQKLQQTEESLDAAQTKISSLEKTKQRLSLELEDAQVDVERANSTSVQLEKKQKAFDKTIQEWKDKVKQLNHEVDQASKENRTLSSDIIRLKASQEDLDDQIESLRRENNNLQGEIKDITDQMSEEGRSVHEIDKARKRLEVEKEEIQNALEEAEAALQQEEGKVMRLQLELAQARQEVERRLQDKDEEFENTRRNHGKIIESMQASLEAEIKGRTEALKMKKKLEADINELEMGIDSANRSASESSKLIKKLQDQHKTLESQVEDEQRAKDEAREQYSMSERRVNIIQGELEELRSSLENSERNKRSLEAELAELNERLNDATTQLSSSNSTKKKMETEIQGLHSEMEDIVNAGKDLEDKYKKALMDCQKYHDELKQEQDHSLNVERNRKALEGQVKELQAQLDDAEANVLKGGKKIIGKLESKVKELTSETETLNRKFAEADKNARNKDRRIKELQFEVEESKKNKAAADDMVEKFNQKLKVYKRQVEEAEEVANMNLAKFKKLQHELDEAEERADAAEQQLMKVRSKARIGTAPPGVAGSRMASRTGSARPPSAMRSARKEIDD